MEVKQWKVFEYLDPVFTDDIRMAFVLGGEGETGILVMRNDEVFTIGSNEHGLLGVKGVAASPIPTKIQEISGKGVKDVSSGQSHAVVCTESGAVYAWGENKNSQLGITTQGNGPHAPVLVGGPLAGKKVIQVSCGLRHTLALTDEGEVFAWGYNLRGQVGTGSARDHEAVPVKVLSAASGHDAKVISVVCGPNMSFAVRKDGKVLNWGGVKDPDNVHMHEHQRTPKVVGIRASIRKLVCGMHSLMALSCDGKLFYWKRDDPMHATPERIGKELGVVVDIGASIHSDTNVCRTPTAVYVWGRWYDENRNCPIHTRFSTVKEAFAYADFPVMYKPYIIERPGSRLADAWQQVFDDKKSADIEFSVQGKTVYAHKLFLKVRSGYFREKLEKEWAEKKSVAIEGLSYNVFRAFMFYLYTDRIDPSHYEETLELLKAAEHFGEFDMHRRCEQWIKASITVENVCKLYAVAAQNKANKLQESTRRFMIPRLAAVIKSDGFAQLGGEIVTRLMRELADLKAFG